MIKGSWKPQVAALATLIVPPVLWFLLTGPAKMDATNATAISGLIMGILASLGLANAKQVNVSNSPTPLSVSQPIVVDVAHPATSPVPLAVPVPTAPPKV